MEGSDHQNGMKQQHHRTGGGAFGSQVPRPPNQKPGIPLPPSHPNINVQVPPSSPSSIPYPQFSPQRLLRSPGSSSSHSRPLSQPPFFSLDSLPPLIPSLANSIPISTDVVMSVKENPILSLNRGVHNHNHNHNTFQSGVNAAFPPHKGHRRSSSDSPLGLSSFFMQSSPSSGGGESSTAAGKPIQLVLKAAATNSVQGDGGFMNGRRQDDAAAADKGLGSRNSGSKTVESSDNEVESHADGKASDAHGSSSSFPGERREGVKRSSNGDILPVSRHHRRSVSLDSSTGNFHIQDGVPKFPPLNNQVGQLSPSNSMDSKTSYAGLEFGNSEFSAEEMEKIMGSDKLVEIALSDPKRAKRILANRQSAARSKERKTQYVTELEHRVQTLQTERTTLSTQVTKLQRDNSELRDENKEYKLRLQDTEQQSQLKDALNERLDSEIQHLRSVVAGLGGESLTNAIARQLAITQQRSQLQQQQQPNHQQRQFVMQHPHPQDEREFGQIQGNQSHPKP